jgi:cysteinyl-tRNA synthetase
VFEYIRDVNIAMDKDEFRAGNVASAKAVLDLFDLVFDVLRPTAATDGLPDEEVEAKIEERRDAKKARNFAGADQIRVWLLDRGIIIEDTKDGVRWKRKP